MGTVKAKRKESVVDGLLEEPRHWTPEDYTWVARLTAEEKLPGPPIGEPSHSEMRYGDAPGADPDAQEAIARILQRRREARQDG